MKATKQNKGWWIFLSVFSKVEIYSTVDALYCPEYKITLIIRRRPLFPTPVQGEESPDPISTFAYIFDYLHHSVIDDLILAISCYTSHQKVRQVKPGLRNTFKDDLLKQMNFL